MSLALRLASLRFHSTTVASSICSSVSSGTKGGMPWGRVRGWRSWSESESDMCDRGSTIVWSRFDSQSQSVPVQSFSLAAIVRLAFFFFFASRWDLWCLLFLCSSGEAEAVERGRTWRKWMPSKTLRVILHLRSHVLALSVPMRVMVMIEKTVQSATYCG